MSRWKHKSQTVTVGDNSIEVRGLTGGQRSQFAQASKDIKEGKKPASDLPFMIVAFGAVDPTLSEQEARDMPTDLLDEAVNKILELTGLDKDEKKAPDAATH